MRTYTLLHIPEGPVGSIMILDETQVNQYLGEGLDLALDVGFLSGTCVGLTIGY